MFVHSASADPSTRWSTLHRLLAFMRDEVFHATWESSAIESAFLNLQITASQRVLWEQLCLNYLETASANRLISCELRMQLGYIYYIYIWVFIIKIIIWFRFLYSCQMDTFTRCTLGARSARILWRGQFPCWDLQLNAIQQFPLLFLPFILVPNPSPYLSLSLPSFFQALYMCECYDLCSRGFWSSSFWGAALQSIHWRSHTTRALFANHCEHGQPCAEHRVWRDWLYFCMRSLFLLFTNCTNRGIFKKRSNERYYPNHIWRADGKGFAKTWWHNVGCSFAFPHDQSP